MLTMKLYRILFLLLLLVVPLVGRSASAAGPAGSDSTATLTQQYGDSLFAQKNYQAAAAVYERLLAKGMSPTVCYNLGNAYYRLNDLPHAILYYERALKYRPHYPDARYNLSVCRNKLGISVSAPSGLFFVTGTVQAVRSRSVDFWGGTALAAFVVALLCWLLFRLFSLRVVRLLTFVGGLVGTLVFVGALTALVVQYRYFTHEQRAVLMHDVTPSAENRGVATHLLVAGTTVTVLDENPDGKVLVEDAGGTCRGWISRGTWEKI